VTLYLDEDLSPQIAEMLRAHGVDAVSAHEVGNTQLDDRAQFAYARTAGRTIVTRNVRDFTLLAQEAVAANMSHSGIILVPPGFRGDEFAEIARGLAGLVARQPKGVSDTVVYLERQVGAPPGP